MFRNYKTIRLYKTVFGKIPFAEWLENLKDRQGRAIIRLRIDRLGLGNPGQYRALGDGLCELKIHFGPGYRVYFGDENNKIILLLCGGDKHSQRKDIATARSYWDEYRRRT